VLLLLLLLLLIKVLLLLRLRVRPEAFHLPRPRPPDLLYVSVHRLYDLPRLPPDSVLDARAANGVGRGGVRQQVLHGRHVRHAAPVELGEVAGRQEVVEEAEGLQLGVGGRTGEALGEEVGGDLGGGLGA